MRKQDRILQQQQQQDPSRQQGEPQSLPESGERVKGGASDAQPERPARKPGERLPIPD